MDHTTLTLANRTDVYHFSVGMPMVLGDDMRPRLATRWDQLRAWAGGLAMSATRWFRPRTVVSAVDVEAGSVSLVTERWSWLRWRWERR